MNIILKIVHNNRIRLIPVELRLLIDCFRFISIRAKMYASSLCGLVCVGDKSILCVCKLYFIKIFQGLFLYFIYG